MSETAEREVEFTETIEETKPDAPPPPKPEAEEDALDLLRPKKGAKKWVFGPEGYEREYVQKPLSFIAKMQWFSLVGTVLDKAMSGTNALSLGNLFSAPNVRGLSGTDLSDADTFVQAVGKLLVYAPNFLEDSYCIWLNVPEYERDSFRQLIGATPDEGGLSDDDGMEIIEIFIDQNYEALDSFFRERLQLLRKRVDQRRKAVESQRSKR